MTQAGEDKKNTKINSRRIPRVIYLRSSRTISREENQKQIANMDVEGGTRLLDVHGN